MKMKDAGRWLWVNNFGQVYTAVFLGGQSTIPAQQIQD